MIDPGSQNSGTKFTDEVADLCEDVLSRRTGYSQDASADNPKCQVDWAKSSHFKRITQLAFRRRQVRNINGSVRPHPPLELKKGLWTVALSAAPSWKSLNHFAQ